MNTLKPEAIKSLNDFRVVQELHAEVYENNKQYIQVAVVRINNFHGNGLYCL